MPTSKFLPKHTRKVCKETERMEINALDIQCSLQIFYYHVFKKIYIEKCEFKNVVKDFKTGNVPESWVL
jgi:hypothetical protein